jgi:CheY-like chemotaxis protein
LRNIFKKVQMNSSQTLLVVEDDSDDRELMLQAIKQMNPDINLVFAENGIAALQYLEMLQEDQSKLPCLIVLDLNMPYIDGKETYRRIKENAGLRSVPVVIFTSSMNPNDQLLFERAGVEFVTKPDHFSIFQERVKQMLQNCKMLEH